MRERVPSKGILEVPRGKRSWVSGPGHAVVIVRDIVAVGVTIVVSICRSTDLRDRVCGSSAVVLLVVGRSIAHGWSASLLEHLHLCLLRLVVLCAKRGEEVDEEAGNVDAVDERYDPLEDGSYVPDV